MPMRRAVWILALLAAACTHADGSSAGSEPTYVPSSGAASSAAAGSASATAPPPTTPSIALPSGLASPFGEDLPAGDVALADLVPPGTDPAGSWYGRTFDGDAIVVAWQAPGDDPFRTDRGFLVWRHTGAPALWRPVFAATYPAARHPILGITAGVADVTGDGSDDVLVFAETGGSGGCGTYLVVDAGAGTEVFRRSVCDTSIDPSSDPPGLTVTEAVFAHGDPHCCPSAMRTTVLQRDPGGTWHTVSVTTTPA